MTITKKIAIFGAGIGGLTVAHELSKYPNYEITIYEKLNDIGGLARSGRDEDGCATEISWRVFFEFYKNLFDTMAEIPDGNNGKNTTLSNLDIYRHTNIFDKPFTLKDKLLGLYNILYGCSSCDERLNNLDNLSWYDSLEGTNKSNVMREIGQWLGMDRYRGSYKSVIKVGFEMNMIPKLFSKNNNDYVTTKPTSEALFYPWKKYLENNGVSIKLNNAIVGLKIANNKIHSARIKDLTQNVLYDIQADYYVMAVPVQILDRIVDNVPLLKNGCLKNVKKLATSCLHIQLSFQIYFDRPIFLGYKNGDAEHGKNNAFMLIEAPWDLIVLQYDQLYRNTQLSTKHPEIKGGWSITVCTSYVPGIVFNKPFIECNYQEAITEIWSQIMSSASLKNLIKKYNNFELNEDMIIKITNYWPTYAFNNHTKKLETTEPKFTNNIGSYALRPSYKTDIDNLFIATAYIKETIDIFSMEAASIAGKHVSHEIDNRSPKPYLKQRPSVFLPFRSIDAFSQKNNLPNLSPALMFIIILITIIIIIFLAKKISRK